MGLRSDDSSFFGLAEHDTDFTTEVLAGVTTFLTMSYIVVVNPQIMGAAIDLGPHTEQLLTVVTMLSAAIACFAMGVIANRPFALAPGLGLNAFFAFTVVNGMGIPWETALAAIVVEGVIFGVLTVVGARRYVIELFPTPVKRAVGAGIGLFLALIGLKEMHVMAGDASTYVAFNPQFATDPVAIISIAGLFATFALYARGTRGSIIIGILGTTVVSYVVAALGYTPITSPPEGTTLSAVKLAPIPIEQLSTEPLSVLSYSAASYDISPLFGAFLDGFANVSGLGFALVVFTFFFVDFFDTAGTLTGVSQAAGFLDEDGNLPEMDRPLLADAVGTTIGGILGTSTVTTYIESATGVEEGGRTGLTAITVGVLFVLSLALVPLAAGIPKHASHIALVVVAVFMLQGITEIDWNDFTQAVPAALTVIVMPFTFSIAYGIAAGIISYPIVKVAAGKRRDVRPGQVLLLGLFVGYFWVRTGTQFF